MQLNQQSNTFQSRRSSMNMNKALYPCTILFMMKRVGIDLASLLHTNNGANSLAHCGIPDKANLITNLLNHVHQLNLVTHRL